MLKDVAKNRKQPICQDDSFQWNELGILLQK